MNRTRVTKSLLSVLLVALIAVSAGCSDDYEGAVVDPFDSAEISAIPDTVHLGVNHLIIESFVNRDFQPISPPEGRPMTASVSLKDINEESLSFSVSGGTLYVISSSKMWVRDLVVRGPYDSRPFQLEMYASDGPKWEPGMVVDIVVFFRDENGKERMIKEEDVKISESS